MKFSGYELRTALQMNTVLILIGMVLVMMPNGKTDYRHIYNVCCSSSSALLPHVVVEDVSHFNHSGCFLGNCSFSDKFDAQDLSARQQISEHIKAQSLTNKYDYYDWQTPSRAVE
eukprot:6157592-Amphidinium_carterae.1